MNQAIISLKPQYVELVLSGQKSVELRNRIVRLEPGTRVWIYATKPVGGIVAMADVESVVHAKPAAIWRRYGKEICINKDCFDSYIGDRECATAMILTSVRKLHEFLALDGIRRAVGSFHPPQFYARLSSECVLFGALNRRVSIGSDGDIDEDRKELARGAA